jgi:hypothetical protein
MEACKDIAPPLPPDAEGAVGRAQGNQMNNSPDEWPPKQDRLAPNDYLAALGQLTFVYNLLESMMRNIFQFCAPLEKDFASKLFDKLNNSDRNDLLSAFVNKNEKEEQVREAVLFCVNCYAICTANRNILMHSIYFNPNPNPRDSTMLVKRASNAQRDVHFDVPLRDLRRIADETAETFRYALNLFAFIAGRDLFSARNTLPHRPPKPIALTPFQPQAIQKDGKSDVEPNR